MMILTEAIYAMLQGWEEVDAVFSRWKADRFFSANPVLTASRKLPKFMAAVDLLDLKTTAEPEAEAVVQLSRFDGGNNIGLVGRTCMPAPMYLAVAKTFGNRLVDSAGIFESLRAIKSPEEIEKMRRAP